MNWLWTLTWFCCYFSLFVVMVTLGMKLRVNSMFPEGISRYHPQLAPFKAGVAMIASDVRISHVVRVLMPWTTRQDFSSSDLACTFRSLSLDPCQIPGQA
jgi:hypothetical protein